MDTKILDFMEFKRRRTESEEIRQEVQERINPKLKILRVLKEQMSLINTIKKEVIVFQESLYEAISQMQIINSKLEFEKEKMSVSNRLTELLLRRYQEKLPSITEQALVNSLYNEPDIELRLEKMKALITKLEEKK